MVIVNDYRLTRDEAPERNPLMTANHDSSDFGCRTNNYKGKSIEEGLIDGVNEKTKITTKMHNFVYINRLFLFYINLQISYNRSFVVKYEVESYYGRVFEDIFEMCEVSPKYYLKFLNKNISFIKYLYDNHKHLLNAKNDQPFINYKINLDNELSDPLDIAIAKADIFFNRYEFETDDQKRDIIKSIKETPNYDIIKRSIAELIDLEFEANMLNLAKLFDDKQVAKKIIKNEMSYEIIENCLKQHITIDPDDRNFHEYVETYEKSIDELFLANLIRDFKKNYIGSDLVIRYRKLLIMRDNFFVAIVDNIDNIWNYVVEKMRSFIR
ncbi:hypothetical protein COBT_002832 [Conglomerata obtusa]